ncbi:response regulator transcription factor [Leifsonia sp. Root112D2]|jgi:DNA-binding NarL/FixJ family response regulator|uniref:response regulator transcription factor n=1 Tax=Leifsonia sp. Root112D2 TaxID=1736426 RepID=UPI0006F704FB|nr:response regulator [Leifsonia sp. Root112D2]KQV06140.1 two-component system response regulator [Leifsonia sp. Root112D2]
MTVPDSSSYEGERVRLALLDDHELLLDSLGSWIAGNAPEFDLVLRASSWLQLVHSPAFPTDLVIMDLQLAEHVSIEARVRTCRAAGAKVIVLSAMDTRLDRQRAIDAGASAYLTKSQPMHEVFAVVRSVSGIDGGAEPSTDWRPLPTGATAVTRPSLSEGERDALKLYADGWTTAEVAAMMNVKYETAKTYLRRVREKYGKAGRPTSSRSDLTRRAAEDGYLV